MIQIILTNDRIYQDLFENKKMITIESSKNNTDLEKLKNDFDVKKNNLEIKQNNLVRHELERHFYQ